MQQINLYQEQFHEIKVSLPAKRLAIVICGLLTVMTLSSVVLSWVNSSNATTEQRLEQEVEVLRRENKNAQTRLESQDIDPILARSVSVAMKQLHARQRIMDWVNASQSDGAAPFSSLLEGLGRQRVEGLWLSQIEILSSGIDLDLRGSTVDPQLLPRFIARLRDEPIYIGREFRRVAMHEEDDNSNIINFRITTKKSPDGERTALATIYGETKK